MICHRHVMRCAGITLTAALVACGGGTPGPGAPDPFGTAALEGPLEAYHQLGFVAGPGFFPVIAGFSTVAGPPDSTFVLFGMSMPNSALRFQRDPNGFAAEYTVTLTFAAADSQVVQRVSRRESVRIPTFKETGRADESIVFQQLVAIEPGSYVVTVEAGDANSSRGFRSQDTLVVPDYSKPGLTLAQPVIIYQGTGRSSVDSVPDLLLNPRHTISYGGDAPRVYIEAYNAVEPAPVLVSVRDEFGGVLWGATTTIELGDSTLRRAMVELPSASLPLGRLFVDVTADNNQTTTSAPIVISISDEWLIASFDEILQFLEYIAQRSEIDSLRNGTPAQRKDLWEAFWKRRDDLPLTAANEYRDEFFQRVRVATEQFSEPGGEAGWRTDRGEVYIVLGPPSFVQERYIGRTEFVGRPNAWEWLYENAPGGRLVLLFLDQNGFGQYELSASSQASFRAIADRLKRHDESG